MSGPEPTSSDVLGGQIPDITPEQRRKVIRRVHRMWRDGEITAAEAVQLYEQLGIVGYEAGKPPKKPKPSKKRRAA